MRLGPVQRRVVAYIKRSGGRAYIGAGTRAEELRGYDLEQVEGALHRLQDRKVVRLVGGLFEIDPNTGGTHGEG